MTRFAAALWLLAFIEVAGAEPADLRLGATHTLDANGYRTGFELRKEIWFGSIPAASQGAVRVNEGLLTVAA